ncbi:hypothetical protein [Streptomyces chartreusis]|uniref:hypothetical protein n=1 Tax=Streptomyces chartreusis TaxID=1969 RepID=UPI0033E98FB9
MTDTRWNGEPCQARRITAIVADNTAFPMYWARHLVGTRRNIVEVTYGDQTFYLDDEADEGWNKVTHGGSPHWTHNNITIDLESIRLREAADGPHCVCGDPIEQTGDPARWTHHPATGKLPLDAHTVRPALDRCAHRGPHPGFTCAEVDQSKPYWNVQWDEEQQTSAADEGARPLTSPAWRPGEGYDRCTRVVAGLQCVFRSGHPPHGCTGSFRSPGTPTEEDAQRTARRASLRNLLDRADRTHSLQPGEAGMLREHVDAEGHEADTTRAALADYRIQLRGLREKVQRYEAELARLHTGEEDDWIPYTESTPGQWLWKFNQATAEERLAVIGSMLESSARGDRCFLMDHERRLEAEHHAQRTLARVRGEIDRWTQNTLESQTMRAISDITRALEPPSRVDESGSEPVAVVHPETDPQVDGARRVDEEPAYVLSITSVLPSWKQEPDGTWSLSIDGVVLTATADISQSRRDRLSFLLAWAGELASAPSRAERARRSQP